MATSKKNIFMILKKINIKSIPKLITKFGMLFIYVFILHLKSFILKRKIIFLHRLKENQVCLKKRT